MFVVNFSFYLKNAKKMNQHTATLWSASAAASSTYCTDLNIVVIDGIATECDCEFTFYSYSYIDLSLLCVRSNVFVCVCARVYLISAIVCYIFIGTLLNRLPHIYLICSNRNVAWLNWIDCQYKMRCDACLCFSTDRKQFKCTTSLRCFHSIKMMKFRQTISHI